MIEPLRPCRYSKKDVLDLKAVFDGYDESRDGKVSLKEFGAVRVIPKIGVVSFGLAVDGSE